MPSAEVAKCCTTPTSSASKKAGADLTASSGPPTAPCSSRDGAVKPLESRNTSSECSSAATITVLVLSGMPGTAVRSQVPGVTTSTRLATSARVTITRWSRVQA